MIFITKRNQFNQTKGVYHEKILFLLFACSIIFTFAGCSSSKKDSAEATTTQEIATTASNTKNTTDSSTSDSSAKNDSYDFSAYKKESKTH